MNTLYGKEIKYMIGIELKERSEALGLGLEELEEFDAVMARANQAISHTCATISGHSA